MEERKQQQRHRVTQEPQGPPTRTRDHGGMKQSRWIPAEPTIKYVAYELESVVGQRWDNDHERDFTQHGSCLEWTPPQGIDWR